MADHPPPQWLEGRAELRPSDAAHLSRARDLVSSMELEEKLPFLHQHSPGLARLGIRPFSTGTEALHGVAWRGPATTYPQPVGLAATWDTQLLETIGQQLAREVRVHHGHEEPASLNVWAPVVNALRHPLWGRTEEGLTEDPLLNARLGTALSRGLRGDEGPWDTVPTLKHFLAYSHEVDRASTSSRMPPRVLHEYELPGFEEALVSGAAGAVMLAYNLVDGIPAHLSPLVNDHLRRLVADPDLLFVVSDAGAPTNLVTIQDAAADLTEAVAAMLRAGVDSFTDHDRDTQPTIRAARAALDAGLIQERHIDQAVVRQLVARARTGEFDAPGATAEGSGATAEGSGPRAGGGPTPPAFDPAAATELSELAAARAAVLLRHRHDALPARSGASIAVLGHLGQTVLRDWYSGELIDPVPLDSALASRHDGPVRSAACLDVIEVAVDGSRVARRDDDLLLAAAAAAPDEKEGGGAATAFEVLDHGLSVISLRETATGRFVRPDDHGFLRARAERIGGWVAQETFRTSRTASGQVRLQHVGSGRWVRIERQTGKLILGGTSAQQAALLDWEVTCSRADQARAAMAGADLVVVVAGNEPHVHGRETEDRPTLALMDPDRELLDLLPQAAPGSRTALVVISSYPYDLGEHHETTDAVVWSSHAGARSGPALASLLLGHREFSGRLAQAWVPEHALTDILDYDVITSEATYLYGQEARFPFGHGLTVNPTRWTDPGIEAIDSGIRARVTLGRKATVPAHEVVQVYASVAAERYPGDLGRVPTTRLIGFQAAEVPAFGTTRVSLEIPWSRLRLWSESEGDFVGPQGPVTIHLARSCAAPVVSIELDAPGAGAVAGIPHPAAPVPGTHPTQAPRRHT